MDYDKFEKLLYSHESAVRAHARGMKEGIAALVITRTALIDAVRRVLAERDELKAYNATLPAGGVALAQVIESGDYEAKVQWLLNPLPVGSMLYEEVPQPISAAEVPMPLYSVFSELVFMQRIFFIRNSKTGEQYGKFQMHDIAEAECQHMNDVASRYFCRADELPMPEPDTSSIAGYSCNALREYGRKREAAGYARGLKEVNTALNDVFSAADGLSSAIDAALRGEVKP